MFLVSHYFLDVYVVKNGVRKHVTMGVMDWRRFSFEYRVRLDRLTSDLIRIEASREAALNLVLPPDWKAQLDQLNRVRAVHGTTALEGNPLSEAEVRQQMDLLASEAVPPSTPSRDQRQVLNAGRAQDWIRRRFTPASPPLRRADILQMHELITEGSDETNNVPGRLRTHPVVVGAEALGGVHRGAPPQEVSSLVDRFVAFVNSRPFLANHPVVRALLAHFFLVTIHPFGDGNGRVSRLVEAGILFQGEYNVFGFYGLSNYFYRHGDEYKRLLQQSRRTQPFDLDAFVAFGVEGFAAELKGINNFIKTKLQPHGLPDDAGPGVQPARGESAAASSISVSTASSTSSSRQRSRLTPSPTSRREESSIPNSSRRRTSRRCTATSPLARSIGS